jgi:mRNA interferase YafQ
MRTIDQTGAFKRDRKREATGQHGATLKDIFAQVLEALIKDEPLAARYRDHALTGNWEGFRDCHLKPDLVLIYQKPDAARLLLVRLGSHAELRLS